MLNSIPSITSPHRRTNSKSVSHYHQLQSFETSSNSSSSYGRDLNKPSLPIPREHTIMKENDNIRDWTFPRVVKTAGLRDELVGDTNFNETDSYGDSTLSYEDGSRNSSGSSVRSLGASNSSSHLNNSLKTSPSSSTTSSPSPPSRNNRRPSVSFAYSGAPSSNIIPTSSFPSSLSALIKLFYTNLRRRSLIDLLYALIFLTSVLVFFGALTGSGHDSTSLPIVPNTSTNPILHDPLEQSIEVSPPNLSRSISPPPSPLPPSISKTEAIVVPADVHQPEGDSSHDTAPEFVKDSPDDARLDDEHTHHYHSNEDNLFEEIAKVEEEGVGKAEVDRDGEEGGIDNGEKIFLSTDEGTFEEEKKEVVATGEGEEDVIVPEILKEVVEDLSVKKPRSSVLHIVDDEEEVRTGTFRLSAAEAPTPHSLPIFSPSTSNSASDLSLEGSISSILSVNNLDVDSDAATNPTANDDNEQEAELARIKLKEDQILGDSFRRPRDAEGLEGLKNAREGLKLMSRRE